MASAIIHLCVAKKVGEKLNINNTNLLLGSIAPDIAKIIGESKNKTHFINIESDIPNIKYFLSKYQKYLDNSFELGYFIHLYTDKLWYESFITKVFCGNSIKLKDGTVLTGSNEFIKDIIYNDYTNINIDLIDKFNLDLNLFYEDISLNKTYIEEYPISKIKLLVDKMGIIIANSNSNHTYMLDLDNIVRFIDESVDIIVNKIDELSRVKPLVSYCGIFFLDEEKQKILSKEEKFLGKLNDELHCTFKYRPTEAEIKKFNNIIGKEVECTVYAYGFNGKHSRFLINIPSEYQEYYTNESIPHITASLLLTEKASIVDGEIMEYKQISPFTIKGIFGYWIKGCKEDIDSLDFKQY